MKERIVTATAEHEAAYQDLCAVLKRHPWLTLPEMLAVASNFVGKLMAHQDQRTMTPERAIEIVRANIEAGNKQAVDELRNAGGGNA
jgi:hypothetical protein